MNPTPPHPNGLHPGDTVRIRAGGYAGDVARVTDVGPLGYTLITHSGELIWHYRRELIEPITKGNRQ